MLRRATPEDLERLLTLGGKMHAESTYRTIAYDRERASKEISWCMEHGLVLVKDVGLPVGMLFGYVKRPWFSSDLVGYEDVLYLSPDHRAGRTALNMIEFWAKWCAERGAKMLRPATSCGVPGANRLYESLGYTMVGGTFVKDIV